jgi:hypothetical protein
MIEFMKIFFENEERWDVRRWKDSIAGRQKLMAKAQSRFLFFSLYLFIFLSLYLFIHSVTS